MSTSVGSEERVDSGLQPTGIVVMVGEDTASAAKSIDIESQKANNFFCRTRGRTPNRSSLVSSWGVTNLSGNLTR